MPPRGCGARSPGHTRTGVLPSPQARAGSPGRPSAPRPAGAAHSSAGHTGGAGTAAQRAGQGGWERTGTGGRESGRGEAGRAPVGSGPQGQQTLAWSWQVATCLLWHSPCRAPVPGRWVGLCPLLCSSLLLPAPLISSSTSSRVLEFCVIRISSLITVSVFVKVPPPLGLSSY